MATTTTSSTQRKAWKRLADHYKKVREVHLRALFAEDPQRGERMAVQAAGTLPRLFEEPWNLVCASVSMPCFPERRLTSRNRAVLRVALRAPKEASIVVDGENVVPHVHAVLDRMADFSDRMRAGQWKGHTGKRTVNIINIGIGGSHLGPVMAYEALKHFS